MSEISISEESLETGSQDYTDLLLNKQTNSFPQINQEKLSPVDYKTQVLLAMFFGWLGADRFNAGKYDEGTACLTYSIITPILLPFVIGNNLLTILQKAINTTSAYIGILSVFKLCSGEYRDCDGKLIRQVVQLKEEEISPIDQKTTQILSYFGIFGIHQFYSGKPLEGTLMLFSLGGLGIWTLINIYQLATCNFRDGSGKVICPSYIKEDLLSKSPDLL